MKSPKIHLVNFTVMQPHFLVTGNLRVYRNAGCAVVKWPDEQSDWYLGGEKAS